MTLTQINKAGLDEIALDHVFTIGASGSSAYTFQGEGLNGTVNNPTLYLTRGKTYRFENGSGGHPIRIQSTSGASGTAYNTGVTNNAGSGTVIVEVQHDAPDVLYYQCTSHAAMNGILYITGALADGGVTTAKIAADAVTGAKIADDAINSEHYTDGSIDTAHIADAQITTTKIADSQIITAKINDSAVTTAKIADDAVTTAKLAAGSVDNTALANNSINGNKLQDNCVATSEIQDSAVTSAKIADGQIGSQHIVDGTIGTGDMSNQSITTAKIANDAVTNAKVSSSAAIAGTKISPDFGSQDIVTTGKIKVDGDGGTKYISVGDNEDLKIYHDANGPSIIADGNNQGLKVSARNLNFTEYTGNTTRFRINDDGHVDVTGNLDVGAGISVTGDTIGTGQFETTGANKHFKSHSSNSGDYVRMYAGAGTGKWDIYGNGANLRISDNDSAGKVQIDRAVLLPDNVKLEVGSSSDLQIYHTGSFNLIQASNGYLQSRASAHYINNADSSNNFIRCENSSGNDIVSLHYNGSKKFEITSYGAQFTGYKSQSSYVGFHVVGTLDNNGFGTNHGSSVTTFDVDYFSPIPMWSSRTVQFGGSYLSFPSYAGGNYIKFTAPVSGLYHLELVANPESHDSNDWVQFGWEKNNTSVYSSHNFADNGAGVIMTFQRASDDMGMGTHFACTRFLAANDYVVLYQQSAASVRFKSSNYYARGTLIS